MANANFAKWQAQRYSSRSGISYENNDAKSVSPATGYPTQMTQTAPRTGKWYVEFYNHVQNGYNVLGIVQLPSIDSGQYGDWLPDGSGAADYQKQYMYYSHNGNKSTRDSGGSGNQSSYGSTWRSAGDIIGCALDMDNGKVWWSVNGTWQNSGDPAAGTNAAFDDLNLNDGYFHAFSDYYSGAGGTMGVNFGQDSTFGGATTAGTGVDDNGFGNFKYSPPTGFLAYCSGNMPTSTAIDPALTDDNYPGKLFNALIYTGNRSNNNTVNNITGVGFQPDLVWLKIRGNTYDHRIVDSSRGVTKNLRSNEDVVEQTESYGLQSFDSDGFTVKGDNNYNSNGDSFIAWCWRANGGTTVSNGDGSITSSVQVNDAGGFSIVTFTSPNSSSDQTVGHGLSAAPDFIMAKNLDTAYNWDCFHRGLDHNTGTADSTAGIRLNTNNTPNVTTGRWGTVNASTITTKNSYTHNGTDRYVFYCWTSVPGYSNFGTFDGISQTNGPFIYTGFRPRMLFIRRVDSGASGNSSWTVWDTARDTHNPTQGSLEWDKSAAETTGNASYQIDVYSNGFKPTSTWAYINSGTMVYGAWGDVPYKYNNAR